VGKNWLSDLGAVYTLGIQPGTEIHDNLFHDVSAPVYGGRGIYLDEGTSQVRVYNNIVYNTTRGLFTQNYGQDNLVSNNIFAFGRDCQIEPSGNMAKAQSLPNSFTFESNIVLLAPGAKMLFSEWNQKTVTMRRNLYWQGGSPIQFGRLSWAQWQAQGFDAGSLAADPLFADPAHYDFTLQDGSPAARIGFQPFDLSGVGPRPARGKPVQARISQEQRNSSQSRFAVTIRTCELHAWCFCLSRRCCRLGRRLRASGR
jgi:hypothetical protein